MTRENTHHRVLIIIDHTAQTCWCGDWLVHWRYATGSTRDLCAVTACEQRAEIGAHVQIDDCRLTGHWYVVPTCRAHVAEDVEPIFIDRRVALLPTSEVKQGVPVWWD